MPAAAHPDIAAARAHLDRDEAGARDVLFDLGMAEVEALLDRLKAPDAPAWLRRQMDEPLRLVAMLAGLMAARLSLEIVEGVMDGDRAGA